MTKLLAQQFSFTIMWSKAPQVVYTPNLNERIFDLHTDSLEKAKV